MGKKGKEARDDWKSYHSDSKEDKLVYHDRPDCDEGKKIQEKHLQPGKDKRDWCEVCQKMWLEAAATK